MKRKQVIEGVTFLLVLGLLLSLFYCACSKQDNFCNCTGMDTRVERGSGVPLEGVTGDSRERYTLFSYAALAPTNSEEALNYYDCSDNIYSGKLACERNCIRTKFWGDGKTFSSLKTSCNDRCIQSCR